METGTITDSWEVDLESVQSGPVGCLWQSDFVDRCAITILVACVKSGEKLMFELDRVQV
jgi:hypothetical protein